jgi:fluoride exporter
VILVLAVAAVGGLGALGRFLLDGLVSERIASELPAGTLAVNLSGSLVLGLVAGLALRGDALVVVATGLLGSYTTFSTWIFESHRLAEEGRGRVALANLALSVAAGVAAVALGRAIG